MRGTRQPPTPLERTGGDGRTLRTAADGGGQCRRDPGGPGAHDLRAVPERFAARERHSHVTQAQVNKLAQDEAAIDQAIENLGLDTRTTSGDLTRVQDVIDAAFHPYLANGLVQKRQVLEQLLPGVPDAHQLASRTDAQMLVVARAAGITGSFHNALSSDEQALTADLGPNPNTDLGPGATDRDPLEVYYNGQIDKFVK